MSTIYQLPTQIPGMVGVYPNPKFMVCGDSLATITTAGYLNQVNLESSPISSKDIIQCLYGYTQATGIGSYGIFTVSISNGVITLVQAPANSSSMSLSAVNTMAAGSRIITDKTTAVTTGGAATINKMSGVLTTPALTTASGTAYTITLTNSEITASSIVLCQIQGGTNTTPGIVVVATPAAGSATILLQNSGVGAAALNGTVIVSFVVF